MVNPISRCNVVVWLFVGILACAKPLTLPSNAYAELLDLGAITRDTETRLDWLDLTSTTGLNVPQIIAQLAPGGLLTGFRYANQSNLEIDVLFQHAGLPPLGQVDVAIGSPVHLNARHLQRLLGVTFIDGTHFSSAGVVPQGNIFLIRSLDVLETITGVRVFGSGGALDDPTVFSPDFGHWLVADEGATPQNPILPDQCNTPPCEPGFRFNPPILPGHRAPRYFDPAVAIGYNYESIAAGLLFKSVLIPNAYGDGVFDLFLFDAASNSYADSGLNILMGQEFDFAQAGFPDGVPRFGIRGIEIAAGVDPNDPLGFVTGLTFSDAQEIDFRMLPIVSEGTTPTPAPRSLWVLGGAAAALTLQRITRRSRPRLS